MKRLCALLLVWLCCAGCSAEQKSQWDPVWADMRGDNMKMRGFGNQ
jgi:hypothetical protein